MERRLIMADGQTGTTVDGQALLKARFGMDIPGVEVPDAIASLLDRRVVRRYTDQPVPDSLLDALLAAAQSAPAKSDLQQYSVVVMRDPARIRQIADWIGTMDWIATAPVFLVWCGDMRRGQRLCDMHDMPHANNNLDTFLNTAVDCTLAMAQFMAAAEAVGLGTCPISYVRSHIERVSPLLGLPAGVYPVAGLSVGWPVFRRPVSMRLPPSIVVHRERYDDSKLPENVAAYDERRRAREPVAPGGLKNNDVYPPREGVGWSENVARQLSVPERFGFAAYLRTKGFDLA
jgi:FMN reductase [NAD(P)H]